MSAHALQGAGELGEDHQQGPGQLAQRLRGAAHLEAMLATLLAIGETLGAPGQLVAQGKGFAERGSSASMAWGRPASSRARVGWTASAWFSSVSDFFRVRKPAQRTAHTRSGGQSG
jgi:hypothetical protein